MTKYDKPQDALQSIANKDYWWQQHPFIVRWLIPALAVLIIVGVIIAFSQDTTITTQAIEPSLIRSIGPDSAPVTIAKYADFDCFTCKAWHQRGILDQVFEKYGDQVRFVWHDFPVTSSNSPKAAEAGFCAHDQGQFWAYHDILYDNAPFLGIENLKSYAFEIGLETQRFNQCLESGQFQETVEKELNAALNLGFRGVPSFLVNDTRLIGPPSFEQLSATIDSILQTSN